MKLRKRILSLFLALSMTVGLVPTLPVFAEEEAQLLKTERADLSDLPEDGTYLTMGNAQTVVSEHGRYILTIYRDGDVSGESSVDVKTVDVSAVYGKDYVVDDDRYTTSAEDVDGTLLERFNDDGYLDATKQDIDSIRENNEKLEEAYSNQNQGDTSTEETIANENVTDETADVETEESAKAESEKIRAEIEAENPASNFQENGPLAAVIAQGENSQTLFEATDEKIKAEAQKETDADASSDVQEENDADTSGDSQEQSPLAAMKEAQTGLSTRDTYESEETQMIPQAIGAGFDMAANMETSSSTTVTFAPGETEKQLIFKILDDKESEGQEMLNFMLSAPVNATVADPFTTTIVIEDDEPVVHSKVSFKEATYNAKDGVATVTFKREDALYAYVTAVVTSKNDTAVSGVNFKAVKGMIEFLPNRDETSIEIPVTPSKDATSFTLELSDLKGGDNGDIMTAEVFIDGSGKDVDSVSIMKAGNSVDINGEKLLVDYSEDSTKGRLYYQTSPNDTVGYYISPQLFSYDGTTGDSAGSYTCKYNSSDDTGRLKWYSGWTWRKGSSRANYYYDSRPYQSVFLDFQSDSNGTTTSMHGFSTDTGTSRESLQVGGKNERKIRGPIRLWYKSSYTDGGTAQEEQRPYTNTNSRLCAYAERVRNYLYEPDMTFYGAVLLNKEYRIEIMDAEQLEYKTANDGTRKMIPGKVSANKQRIWHNGILVLNNDPILGQKQKWGQLVGYDIKCGTGPNAQTLKLRPQSVKNSVSDKDCYFAPSSVISDDCATITFTTALTEQIDSKTGALQQTTNGYYTNLEIKPVYEKIPVKINVQAADDNLGKFDSQYLQKSSTGQLFFGDEISLSATSYEDGVRSDGYAYKAYLTTGDTLADITSDNTNIEENPTMQLCYRKYDFKPLFTDLPNHIEIDADSDILRFFDISNTISGEKAGVDSLSGKTLLVTDGNKDITPITGKAYKIELVPKQGVTLPTDRRPVITSVYDSNTYVDGYVMDIIAKAQYKQNKYTITFKNYIDEYRYYALDGKAIYSSIAIMDNTKPLTSEPAKMNSVTAGGWLADGKDKTSGADILVPQRQSVRSGNDGTFALNGVKAVPGDVISVLISNNNMDQVVYLPVSDVGKTESRSFQETTGFQKTTNRYGETEWQSIVTEVTKDCLVVDMNTVELPVRTAYAPYVMNVSLAYGQQSIAGNSTSVPLPDEPDTLICSTRVETNNTDVKMVEFIVYRRDGAPKGTVSTVAENSSGKINEAPQYTYRSGSIDENGYCQTEISSADLTDGDMLFVRIIGNEQNSSGEFLTYPIINVGVTFYTPIAEEEGQSATVNVAGLGNLPLIGDIASSLDTGKLIYNLTYADPKNTGTSSYVRTIGISANIMSLEYDTTDGSTTTSWFNKYAFDKATKGEHKKAKKTNKEIVDEQMSTFNVDDITKSMSEELQETYKDEIEKEDAKRADDDKLSKDDKIAIARGLFEKEAYKNSITKAGDSYTVDLSAKVIFQLLYAYDFDKQEHVFVGGEYLIAADVQAKKIWYWVINGVPIFVNVKGSISVQVDGSWLDPQTDGGTAITAKELRQNQNILNNRFRNKKNGVPWVQLGMNVNIMPGVGICGVLDVHGTLSLKVVTRFTFTGEQNKDSSGNESMYGVMVDFSGGIGVSLFIVNVNFQIGRVKQGWGVYDTKGPILSGPQLSSEDDAEYSENGYTAKLVPFDVGNEQKGDSEFQLMSVLKPIGEAKNIRENTMEKIEPAAVQISDNGDLFVAYISGEATNDTANASMLKYMLRDGETGEYSDPITIDDDDIGDTSPSLLYVKDVGDKGTVYVAWSSAEKKFENLTGDTATDLEKTKNNLNSLNIYMRAYDVATNTWGDIITVQQDNFENTNVHLVEENGKVELYYFKRNLDNIENTTAILSMTQNYTTWAKQIYNPAINALETIGTYTKDDKYGHKAGTEYTEQLIYFPHPTLTDPLVMNLNSETYTYTYGNDDPIEYSFYVYTIDKDGNYQTTSDREIWLQITNVTNNKTYYPVLIANATAGNAESNVAMPQLTAQGDDLLITWISDGSKFNLISAKDTLDAIRTEYAANEDGNKEYDKSNAPIPSFEDSALKVFMDADPTERFWYRKAGEEAAEKINNHEGICSAISKDEFSIISKDFGSDGKTEALRKELPIDTYQLLTGNDGNVYLFWTSASDRDDVVSKSIYASAYYRVNDAVTDKYGVNDQIGKNGFSDAVVISDSGLMIDELTAAVASDSSALILANTYERKTVKSTDYTLDPFVNGSHNLTEFIFAPFNSLSVVDQNITLQKVKDNGTTVNVDYPQAGDKIQFAWEVKNTGLLPSYGDYCKIEVLNDSDEVLYSYDETNSGEGESIYVGATFNYRTAKRNDDGTTTPLTWTVPEGQDISKLKVKLTVQELDKDGEYLDDPTEVVRVLQQQSSIQYQPAKIQTYADLIEEINDKAFAKLEGMDFDIYDDDLDEASKTVYALAYMIILYSVINDDYPELSAVLEKITPDNATNYTDLYDYMIYLPVRNIGNSDAKLTAKFKYLNADNEETDIVLGTSVSEVDVKPVSPDSDEMSKIAIPITVDKDLFSKNGLVKGLIDVYEGDTKIIENIETFIFADGNIDFTLTSEDETVSLEKGSTYTIEAEAYPFEKQENFEYTSSDMGVVTISNDGVVTAVGAGEATVEVTEVGAEKMRKINFKVTDNNATPTPSSRPSSGGGGSSTYKVNVNNVATNGTISASKSDARVGDTITITATPNTGYEVKDVIVKDKDGNAVKVTKNADGTYSYVQPVGAVSVDAEFLKVDSKTDDSKTDTNTKQWFKDVPESAWYYAPIKEAYDNAIMSGVSDDYFEPETNITRGMFAYAIYNKEGLPQTNATNTFGDVKAGSYYETAIAWATENKIIEGYDDTHYGPDDPITREQAAVILWRYAKYKNHDVSVGEDTNIMDYTDVIYISEYAVSAIQWVVGDGIITGFEDYTIRPGANATRAQMAVILNKLNSVFN